MGIYLSQGSAVASGKSERVARLFEPTGEPEGSLFAAVAAYASDLPSVDVVLDPGVTQALVRADRPGGVPIPFDATEAIRAEASLPSGALYSAALDADYASELIGAFGEAGATIARITSSEFAWAEGVKQSVGPERALAVVGLDDLGEIRLLAVEAGAPVAWRRLPIDCDEAAFRDALATMADDGAAAGVVVLGDDDLRVWVAGILPAIDTRAVGAGTRLEELNFDPAAVAATFAGTGPCFVPPAIEAADRTRNRRIGFAAAAAAVALLAGAGVLDLLDLRAEARAMRLARTAHSAQVAQALGVQASLTDRLETMDALESLRRNTPRWTALLGTIADALPATAHLTGFRASADSVYLDIEGSDVADAVERLRPIPWWTGLRTASVVQTELSDDGSAVERLTVAAHPIWELLNPSGGDAP